MSEKSLNITEAIYMMREALSENSEMHPEWHVLTHWEPSDMISVNTHALTTILEYTEGLTQRINILMNVLEEQETLLQKQETLYET